MDLHATRSNTTPKLLPGAGSDAPAGPIDFCRQRSLGDLRHEQVYVNNTGQPNPSPACSKRT